MGQCILRDLGFEFERDPKKQQTFESYLLEKIRVKYPPFYTITKDQYGTPKGLQSEDNFRTPTVLDKMVQTNELDEEEFSQLQIMNLDNDVQVEAVAQDNRKKYEGFYDDHNQDQLEQEMIQPLGGGNRTEPLRISKDQTDYDSENKLYDIKKRERLSRLNTIESKEHDLTASRASLNKVITVRGAGENTQYKSLSASQNIPTEQDVLKNNDSEGDDLGKSDEFEKPKKEYKGFVNNYFSVSKNRSPSPLTRSQNIFTDEEDSPYEDR